MDVKDKLIEALQAGLTADYIRIEEEDGLSGFVVSPQFEGVSTLDRQSLIDKAIGHAPHPLSEGERRRVLMIAGLTPAESDAVGAGVRVHGITEEPDGWIKILLHGGPSDAEYVRGAFRGLKDVQTTDPEDSPGGRRVMMFFRAKGDPSDPLTKEKAAQTLGNDPYVLVMAGA